MWIKWNLKFLDSGCVGNFLPSSGAVIEQLLQQLGKGDSLLRRAEHGRCVQPGSWKDRWPEGSPSPQVEKH